METTDVFIIFQKVYYPLLCVVGIPGNLLTFYVMCFHKCGMSETAVIYLSCLALVDLSYLVWVILLDLCLTFLQLEPFWHVHPWCGILGIMQYGALCSSSWVVVVFTIERYLVLSVTTARQRAPRSRYHAAIFTCVGIVLYSHLVSVPMFWLNEVTPVNLTRPDAPNVTLVLPRCRYREALYSTVMVWVTTFLSGGIPIILVIIYNSLIAYHLGRSSRLFTKEDRRSIRSGGTRSVVRRTILLLGTVSLAFVVLSLPRFVTYCILRTMYNDNDFDRNDYSLPINVISDLANMLQNLNSTTNFLLYCMVSHRFRHELLKVFTCRRRVIHLSSFLTHNTIRVFSIIQHNSRKTTKDTAKDVAKDETKDTAKDVAKDETKDTAKDVAKDEAKDTAKDVAKDETKDTAKDVAKDETKDTAKDVAKDEAKDTAKDIFKDSKDTAKDMFKDSKDTAKDIFKDSKDTAKDAVEDEAKDTPVKDETKGTAKDAVKVKTKDNVKEETKDTGKDNVKDETRNTEKVKTKNYVKAETKDSAKYAVKDTTKNAVQNETKDT